MKLGIIGKPQSGKTTVFNAAALQNQAVGDYSKAIHVAQIKVPDERLAVMADLIKPKKVTPAQIEFLDAPGLSGKGKQSGVVQISDDLRQTDAFLTVVDAFSADARPEADIQSLNDEMTLLDQVLAESNLERRSRRAKLTGDNSQKREIELLERCVDALAQERPLRQAQFTGEEDILLRGYQFLTRKPRLIVLNIAESDLARSDKILAQYNHLVEPGWRELEVMCGKLQMELVGLKPEERVEFMKDLGIKMSATDKVIQKSYALLGLISFITVGEPDVRAWTIARGTSAQKAAGAVHSDMERGFIRAEVVAFEDYVEHKTQAALKAAGKTRLEGKEYVVADGDVILFRFNV